MSNLNIIVAGDDSARLYAALETAMAQAALGRRVRLFLQGEAVGLLRAPITHVGDAARVAAGQPDLAWLVNEAGEMGVSLMVCQSGLALAAMTLADCDAIVQAAGLVGFLSSVDPGDMLVTY